MTDTRPSSFVPATVEPDARKTAALWADTRFIVIDTETTKPPKGTDRSLRVVSFGAVTCRRGAIREQLHWLIDPGCPIDPRSQEIHHIDDDMVEGQPSFADRAQGIIDLFTEVEGERRVIVGFNVAFDIAVLRYELELLGLTIPPVTILDTRGKLAQLAGIPAADSKLGVVAAQLGITNTNPHDALGDATATARVLIEQFNRVAALDHTDLEELLDTLGGARTAQDVPSGAWIADRAGIGFVAITKEHAAEHSNVLPAKPSKAKLLAWERQLETCAELRCTHITDAVLESKAPTDVRLDVLHRVLAGRLAAHDAAGAATVTGALLPLLQEHHAAMSSRHDRPSALRWAKQWGPEFDKVSNCETANDADLCPWCRNADTCPIDLWPDVTARCAYHPNGKSNDAFFALHGNRSKRSTYSIWLEEGVDHRIADAGLWLMCENLTAIGQTKSANMVALHAVRSGCRHPGVAAICADGIAAGGTVPRLSQAVALCDDILTDRHTSTVEHWLILQRCRDRHAGQLERLTARFDIDPTTGATVPRRRHETTRDDARTRRRRFAVNGPAAVELPADPATPTVGVSGDKRAAFAAAINTSLAGSYNAWGIERWWHRPRTMLDGRTPHDVVAAADFTTDGHAAAAVRRLADQLIGAGQAT